MSGQPSSRVAGAVGLAVVVAALAPRVGPALARYQPSNDAAEHLLIARSLARGEGFTLPIRVRRPFDGPAVHDALPERAPLYPLLLSVPVRLGPGAQGWPDPRLQLLGCALSALASLLAVSLALALARARGLAPDAAAWAALGAGLAVAWLPGLVRASIHLWAEPLGLVLVLGAMRLELALARGPGEEGRPVLAALVGLLAALARFARPEAWVIAALLPCAALLRAWRAPAASNARRARALEAGLVLALVVVVNALGIAATGVLAPQLDLLRVARFEDLMDPAAPAPLDAGTIATAIAGNAASLARYALSPKEAYLVLPLALLALLPWRGRGRPAGATERALLLAALALALATALVWSTRDPHRFALAPLALLAPVAFVEVEARRRALAPGRARPRALVLGALILVLGHHAGRELHARPPAPPTAQVPEPGVPALEDPWTYALITDLPATLAPTSR